MRISVCTFDGRGSEQLANFVLALRRSARPPAELVIAASNNDMRRLPPTSFPIRLAKLPDDGPLSHGQARNAAAARTSGELLVFLDPDCLPHPRLLDDYAAAARRSGLLQGEVSFLPPGAVDGGIDFGRFEQVGVADPARSAAQAEPVEPCRDYRRFEALNFAISAADFAATGGFDERYLGHGGEDTDFSRKAMSAGLPFALVRGARAFHQYSEGLALPLDDLDAILANAALFEAKWNQPLKQDQLRALELMGLIGRSSDGWRKLRDPDEHDRQLAAELAGQAAPSAGRLIERLEKAEPGKRSGTLRPAA
jgi:GT2 family glycosyltransferase